MIYFCLLLPLVAADPEPALRIRAAADAKVEVVALLPAKVQALLPAGQVKPDDGERYLRLARIDPETGREGAAMLGAYERKDTSLVFRPRFALTPGQRYRATLELPGQKPITVDHAVPERDATPPVVEQIFPTGAELPANHLKFYIHFSKPMREGAEIFDHINLLDAAGKPLDDPWRRTELWSADGKRLTLWIHPGRIKRGVNLREEFGPVLEPRKEYTLELGTKLCDTDGRPLAKAFTKKFRTGPEERTRPRVEAWKLTPPAAAGRDALLLEFPRPLDRALLDRCITVTDAHGKPVVGRIEIGKEERSLEFRPEKAWQVADYQVRVDERLEDLAGNTPVRLFDVDLSDPKPGPAKLSLAFRPK